MRTLTTGGFLACALLLGCGASPAPAPAPATPTPSPAPREAAAHLAVSLDAPLATDAPGAVLVDVSGWFHAGAEPAETLDQIPLALDRDGAAALGSLVYARPWRGLTLPHDAPTAGGAVDLSELRARITQTAGGLVLRVGSRRCTGWDEVREELQRVQPESGGALLIDAGPDVPAGYACTLLAVALERGLPVRFAAPDPAAEVGIDPALFEELAHQASGVRRDELGLRRAGVRLRVDARSPWGAVQGALLTISRALIHRVTFVVAVDGAAVDLYPRDGVTPAPSADAPAATDAPPIVIEEPVELAVPNPDAIVPPPTDEPATPTPTDEPATPAPVDLDEALEELSDVDLGDVELDLPELESDE